MHTHHVRSLVLAAALLLGALAALPVGAAQRSPLPRPPMFQPRGNARARARLATDNRPLFGRNRTLKAGLAGEEEGDNDTAISPTLSALCQSLLGQPNPYANPAPNVDQIVNDTVVPVGSQAGCNPAQNETTIAVNPANPRNLVAGTNDYRLFNARENRNDGSGWAYTSFDGGQTWANVLLPGLTYQSGAASPLAVMDAAGDPVLAFGPNNTVYYGNIVFSRLNDANGITVNVSHDGGLTWDPPAIVQLDGVDGAGNPVPTDIFNDKVWLTADSTSGTVYVTWTRFDFAAGESPIVIAKSTDFGRTWSPWRPVSPTLATFVGSGITPYDQGSRPQIGRRGEVYVAYEGAVCQTLACDQPGDADATIVAKSTDGGQTFTSAIVDYNFDFPLNPDVGRATLTDENFRINSFPSFSVDPATGNLFVAWADDRNGTYDASGNSIKTNGDVFVAGSPDGVHWTPTAVIGTSADEVFPEIAAFRGRKAVSFYTRAYDPSGIGLDYAMWTPGRFYRVTTQTQNPQVQFVGIGRISGQVLQGVFIGDYTALTIGSDLVAHPCWTDFRGRPGINTPNQDAYTQAIPLR